MATDDFDRANGGLGSNWTDWAYFEHSVAALRILSNQCRQDSGGAAGFSFWNADAFSADQQASVTIVATGPVDEGAGVGLRMKNSGGTDGCLCLVKNTVVQLYEVSGGSKDDLGTGAYTLVGGDELKGTVEGTALKVLMNDVEEGSATTTISGADQPGIAIFEFADHGTLDDWEGGELVPPPAPPELPYVGLMEVDLNTKALMDVDLAFVKDAPVGALIMALVRDGGRFFRHKLLRQVWAREVLEVLPRMGRELRRRVIDALRRSTRAWLTREPNLGCGAWHVKRCRDLWLATESYSPKFITG